MERKGLSTREVLFFLLGPISFFTAIFFFLLLLLSAIDEKEMNEQDIQRKILAGKKKRKEQALSQKVQKEEEVEDDDPNSPLAEQRRQQEAVTTPHYLAMFLCTLVFISLPLSEDDVDWTQVAAFIGVGLIWVFCFHRNTWLHIATFVLLNMVLVQWSVFVTALPDVLGAVPKEYYIIGGVLNGAVTLGYYFARIRNLPPKLRLDAWDLFACCLVAGNFIILVACGIIPLSTLYLVFKSVIGLVTNFQIQSPSQHH